MKNYVICTLALILFTSSGSTAEKHLDKGSGSSDPRLRLTVEPIKLAYCSQPEGGLALRMLLLLRFSNDSTRTLILQRGAKLPYRITVYNAQTGAPEIDVHNTLFLAREEGLSRRGENPSNLFVLLKKGESYESTSSVTIPVSLDRDQDSVSPGEHYLSVAVWTWNGSGEASKLLGARWRKIGILWDRGTASEKTLISVADRPAIQKDCQCEDSSMSEERASQIAKQDAALTNVNLDSYAAVISDEECEYRILYLLQRSRKVSAYGEYLIDKTTGKILFKQVSVNGSLR